MVDSRRDYLAIDPDDGTRSRFCLHSSTGRPIGSKSFLQQLEELTRCILLPQKRGPKSKRRDGEN